MVRHKDQVQGSFAAVAQAYAGGVNALLAPSGLTERERGVRAPLTYEGLAVRAATLAPLGEELTRAASAQLTAADPSERLRASSGLLAKALTDLEIGAYLLRAAADEEAALPLTGAEGLERSALGSVAGQDALQILVDEASPGARAALPPAPLPADVPAARRALSQAVESVLALILDRASKSGQAALAGLLGLGVAEVARAAAVVGLDIAQALGQAEKVTQLYELFRRFVLQAYDSLLALLGPEAARSAARALMEWLDKVREGEQFGRLLDGLYQTQTTAQALDALVAGSQAELGRFVACIQGVEGIDSAYGRQVGLVEQLLPKLKWLGLVPATVLPQGRLLLAAAYIVLGSYVVLAGADYADAQALRLLDRVPGVRRVVENNLSGS